MQELQYQLGHEEKYELSIQKLKWKVQQSFHATGKLIIILDGRLDSGMRPEGDKNWKFLCCSHFSYLGASAPSLTDPVPDGAGKIAHSTCRQICALYKCTISIAITHLICRKAAKCNLPKKANRSRRAVAIETQRPLRRYQQSSTSQPTSNSPDNL